MEKLELKKTWPILFLFLLTLIFFWKFFFRGLLPIPSDTIVGMYHPWRDALSSQYPNGVPFKNFLITDPVRQQYPWRQLAVSLLKNGNLPVWNPYNLAGTPLLANFQGAVFYPLNFLFFLLPFNFAWGILIFLQPLLAGTFLYFYLRNLKISQIASLIGAFSFSFSGFFVAWLEWGTVLHVALWLPLVLLSIDKIIYHFQSLKLQKFKLQILKTKINSKRLLVWEIVFIFSLSASFLAGHLQTFFYLVLFSFGYLLWRLFQIEKNRGRLILLFAKYFFFFVIITIPQWLPTLKFIGLSARGIDLDWQKPGWFIPMSHLVQFLAPDFFGNPTTLNYWGEWNYAEFLGYLGVVPLVLALWGFWGAWRDKNSGPKRLTVLFFGAFAIAFLSFALPTPWAKLPYLLKVPFLSTSQPTRLLFLVNFCLAVLAAFGMERLSLYLKETREKKNLGLWVILGFFGLIYGILWGFVFLVPRFWPGTDWVINLTVSKRNLILPTGLFMAFSGFLFAAIFFKKIAKKGSLITPARGGSSPGRNYYLLITLSAIFLLTIFDLFRFGWKFTPFTQKDWLFPTTKTIEFLNKDPEVFRIMSADRRLFPPNFSVVYQLQSIDGYDPLYLLRFGELIAAMERRKPDISPPFGFNRIITPENYESKIADLLNVKYVLSLTELESVKLKLVFQEGQTRIYQNNQVLPRAFMVFDYRLAQNRQQAVAELMSEKTNLSKTAVLEETDFDYKFNPGDNKVRIVDYSPNKVTIEVETDQDGILIFTDAYYPGWKATISGKETKIFRADYNFRAVLIFKGSYSVVFEYD